VLVELAGQRFRLSRGLGLGRVRRLRHLRLCLVARAFDGRLQLGDSGVSLRLRSMGCIEIDLDAMGAISQDRPHSGEGPFGEDEIERDQDDHQPHHLGEIQRVAEIHLRHVRRGLGGAWPSQRPEGRSAAKQSGGKEAAHDRLQGPSGQVKRMTSAMTSA
jgi:hypothetical protein